MVLALHGQTTLYNNLASDIRIAGQAGYSGLEIATAKLLRCLDAGVQPDELTELFRRHAVQPVCIDILGDVERIDPEERKRLLSEAERLCSLARYLGCPTVQLNAFNELEGRAESEVLRLTARNVADIADIGAEYGIRFQIEGAAWTPIHSLVQCLKLIEMTERENVGLVIDFWHLWASRDTSPEEVARLNQSVIFGVHLCDGLRPSEDEGWPDERLLRDCLPGDGQLPVAEWVAAIQATGYDGVWSGEILGHRLWEMDHLAIARKMRERMESYLQINKI
jgi:sugar phosphate isomerase/epimerase